MQRAPVMAAMLDDLGVTAGEAGLRAGSKSVGRGPMGVERCNAAGVSGLDDRPRWGRRPTHPPEGGAGADQPGVPEAAVVGLSL